MAGKQYGTPDGQLRHGESVVLYEATRGQVQSCIYYTPGFFLRRNCPRPPFFLKTTVTNHAVHYIPRTYLSYNWKFAHLTTFTNPLPLPLAKPICSLYLWAWVFFFFFFLDSIYKWDHIFVFLCLTSLLIDALSIKKWFPCLELCLKW